MQDKMPYYSDNGLIEINDNSACTYSDKLVASLSRRSYSYRIKMEKAEYRCTGGADCR